MRSSELLKKIKQDPELHIAYLKSFKLTGQVNEARDGKIWRTHQVNNGVHNYKLWKNDQVILEVKNA
jgi:hypothetical protein